MKLTTAIASMEAGSVIFSSDIDDKNSLAFLDGLVANSELCKCQHGEFTWYFAWRQKSSESEADKALQMAKAIRPTAS